MTCWVDPETGDVFDHTGSVVGNIINSHNWEQSWSGDYPDEALDILYQARDVDQTSSYNQQLLFCIAAEQIEIGTP
jgi:hypothetical protein